MKCLAVLAVVAPFAASAATGIRNSKHDLSSTSTSSSGIQAGTVNEVCIFCHTPHNADAQKLLWNKTNTNHNTGWGATDRTTAGTTLPPNLIGGTVACLTCHDGTTAMGAVLNYQGAAGTIALTGPATEVDASGLLANARYIVGGAAAGAINRNHPVSLPYPGQALVTYNGLTSPAPTGFGGYRPLTSTAGSCGTAAACVIDGTNQARLYQDGVAGYGVECGSCHEPHDMTNTAFLRISNAGSALCLTCHQK